MPTRAFVVHLLASAGIGVAVLRWLMRRCRECGRYTLRRDRCPVCGGELYVPHPPRFSPEDKYVAYRYRLKLAAGLLAQEREGQQRDEAAAPAA